MKCPRCRHENHSTAKFCGECGGPLLPLLLSRRAVLQTQRADHRRARHTRRPSGPREIVVTLVVVLLGAAIIIGIVAGNPRWHTILASWREGFQASFAKVSQYVATIGQSAGDPPVRTTLAHVPPTRSDAMAAQKSSSVTPGTSARLSGAHLDRSGATAMNSAHPQDPTRLAVRPLPGLPPDNVPIMANLLVAELGPRQAWRTALSNADAHAPDSPEFDYWHRVAAAVRDATQRR